MKIINTVSSSGGSYRIQDDPSRTSPPSGYARVPEELDLTEFYAAKGFVSPSFEDDVMTGTSSIKSCWTLGTPHIPIRTPLSSRRQRSGRSGTNCWQTQIGRRPWTPPSTPPRGRPCVHTGRHCGICRSKRGFRQTSSGRSCRRPPKPCPIP